MSELIWVLWFIIFGAAEILLFRAEGEKGTLSAKLRMWLGIDPPMPWRPFGIVAVAGFCVWFLIHIVFGL